MASARPFDATLGGSQPLHGPGSASLQGRMTYGGSRRLANRWEYSAEKLRREAEKKRRTAYLLNSQLGGGEAAKKFKRIEPPGSDNAEASNSIEPPGSASGLGVVEMVPLQDMLFFNNWRAACMTCTSMEQSSRPQRMAHMYRIIRKNIVNITSPGKHQVQRSKATRSIV